MITRVQSYSAPSMPSGSGTGRIQVIPKTDFSWAPNVGASPSSIPLSICIDTTDWVTGVLLVRLHTKGTWASTTASVEIAVQNVLYAPDDPSVLFASTATDVAKVTIAGSDSAPKLYAPVTFTAGFGPQVRVEMRLVAGTTSTTALHPFAISVELVGRDA